MYVADWRWPQIFATLPFERCSSFPLNHGWPCDFWPAAGGSCDTGTAEAGPKTLQLQPLAFGMLPLGNCLQWRRPRFDPWVGKIPWRRKWQPTPVFLPGEFHRQRSLVGYSPRDHRVRRDCATNSIFKPFPHSGQHHGKQKNHLVNPQNREK